MSLKWCDVKSFAPIPKVHTVSGSHPPLGIGQSLVVSLQDTLVISKVETDAN